MRWSILHATWPVLVPLATCLVTASLAALCRHTERQREIHDLLRQTSQMRRDYLESLPLMEHRRLDRLASKAQRRYEQDAACLQRLQDAVESQKRRTQGKSP